MGKITDKAQAETKTLPEPIRARDFADVPCTKRTGIIDRYIKRAADRRDKLRFDAQRVSDKLVTVATLRNPGWEAVLRDASNAHDTLTSAARVCDNVIRSARAVRTVARKACRRKR